MKILFQIKLNKLWLKEIEQLRLEFTDSAFITEKEKCDKEIEDAQGLVIGEADRETLIGAKQLEIIFVPYAGINALPLEYIKERGIRVSNVHGNAPYVAERAVGMALSFYGRIIDYHNDLKRFKWHGYWATGKVNDSWDSIQGRTCAVIGTGEIGRHVAKYLKIFNCHIIGFKKRPTTEIPKYFDEVTHDLREALTKAELIFIALPLTENTVGIISAEILRDLKGKFLVNVGRGELVNEEGLYLALKDGTLKGAGIDVWYTYPEPGTATGPPSKYPIQELPNVVLSPHLAGFTPQAAERNISQTMENIRTFIVSGKARWEIDPESMY